MKEWGEIIQLKKEEQDIAEQIGELERVICEKLHPYKIGDVIVIKGHSFRGRNMKVTDVWFRESCGSPRMGVRGIVLNAKGEETKNTSGWCELHDGLIEFALETINTFAKA